MGFFSPAGANEKLVAHQQDGIPNGARAPNLYTRSVRQV